MIMLKLACFIRENIKYYWMASFAYKFKKFELFFSLLYQKALILAFNTSFYTKR